MKWHKSKSAYLVEKPSKDVIIVTYNLEIAQRAVTKFVILMMGLLLFPILAQNFEFAIELFGLVVTASLYSIRKTLSRLRNGESYCFDSTKQSIVFNNGFYANFKDVTQLAFSIRYNKNPEDDSIKADRFCLQLKANNQKKPIRILGDDKFIKDLIEQLAALMQVDYVYLLNGKPLDGTNKKDLYRLLPDKNQYSIESIMPRR